MSRVAKSQQEESRETRERVCDASGGKAGARCNKSETESGVEARGRDL